MKNFSIRYAALFAALTILLTGCLDIFDPQDNEAAGLHITIANDNARTLFPNTNFTKYVLRFQNASASRPDITLTGGESSVTITDLADGDWDITAVGYVTIDGTEYAAAEGTAQVTVSSQSFQGVTIPITASMSGPDGFFSYAVSFPEAKVQSARLAIYPFSQWPQNEIDLLETPADTITLAPGYYMMTIRLQTGYETAARTEVVHIYSNMETVADYHFTEDDFTRTITLSGTVDITVDGQLPLNATVYAYLDAAYTVPAAGSSSLASVDLDNGTWTMTIPPFDTDTTLYFQIYVVYDWSSTPFYKGTGITRTVKDQNISGINLGTIGLTTLTLSGTAILTRNGNPYGGRVFMYTDAAFQNRIVSIHGEVNYDDSTWSVTVPAFDVDTLLYFTIQYSAGNGYYGEKDTGVTRTVKDGIVSGIDFGAIDLQDITLSGTIDFKVNGRVPVAYARLYGYLNQTDANPVGYGTIDLENNTWLMTLPPSVTDRVLYFRVNFGDSWAGDGLWKEISTSVTVKNQDISAIDFGAVNVPIVTLSGTAVVTIDGEPFTNTVGITAYSNDDIVFSASAYPYSDYTWSVTLDPFETDTLLRFSVSFNIDLGDGHPHYVQRETGVSITVKDQSTDNIALAYNLPLLTLGGTVTVTVNGATPQGDVYVYAYGDNVNGFHAPIDLQNNTWSAKMLPFDADTTLYFVVYYEYRFRKDTGITITAKDQNNTNIDLGTVNFNVITLSGTVDITLNGNTPYSVYLSAYRDALYSDGVFTYVGLQEGNAWAYILEPFETDTPLYFVVGYCQYYWSDWITKELGALVTAKDQNISGIAIVRDFTD